MVNKSGSDGLKRRFEGRSVFSLGAHWFLTHNRLDYNWENLATTTNNPMTDEPIREPEPIRQSCSRKLHAVQVSGLFAAILSCLLGEDWATPRIVELQITVDRGLLARIEGQNGFDQFLGAESDLIRNIHGVAEVAELDGDEVGYLIAKVAKIKLMA